MENTLFEIILKLLVLFAPFALIPFTFKLAGGMISRIYGAISGAGAGRIQMARRRAVEKTGVRRQQFLKGSRFAESSRLGRAFNVVGRRAGAGFRGRYGFGQRGAEAIALGQSASVEETLKANPLLQQLAMDDSANSVMALSGGSAVRAEQVARRLFGDSDEGRAKQARTLAAVRAVGVNRSNATAALTTMAQNKSRSIAPGQFQLVEEGIQALAQGNKTVEENLSNNFQFHSRNAGRIDLGGRWQDEPSTITPGGPSRADRVMLDGLNRTEMPALVRGYPNQVQAATDAMRHMLDNGSAKDRTDAAVRILELQNSLPYATGDSAAKINGFMSEIGVDFSDGAKPLRDQLADQLRVGRAGQALRDDQVVQVVSGNVLQSNARVYDREQYRDQQGRGEAA